MSETVKAWWYIDGSDDVYPMHIEYEQDTCHLISISMPVKEFDGTVQTLRYVLDAENEKLRELVHKVEYYETCGCQGCPHENECEVDILYDENCLMSKEIEREKMELGIEVYYTAEEVH